MTRHQHVGFLCEIFADHFDQFRFQRRLVFLSFLPINFEVQGINHRIAGDLNDRLIDVFASQIVLAVFRWRKVQTDQRTGQFAIGFFRKWRTHVASTKSGFDVTHRNAAIETAQCRSEDRCGIALNQSHIWLRFIQQFIDPRDQSGRQRG